MDGRDHDASAYADQTRLRLKMVKKIEKVTLKGEEEVKEEDYMGQGTDTIVKHEGNDN
jgi:hypothetical protein